MLSRFPDADNPKHKVNEVRQNASAVALMCDYTSSCHNVVSLKSDVEMQVADVDFQGPLINALCEFCRLHHLQSGTSGVQLECSSIATDKNFVDCLAGNFASFASSVGGQLYEQHTGKFIATCVSAIFGARVEVSMVHSSVLAMKTATELFALLIVSPTSGELMPSKPLQLSGVLDDDVHVLDSFHHNQGLETFERFAEAVGLQQVAMKECFAGDGREMPIAGAKVLLKMACSIRDVATVAAVLQERLLKPSAMKAALSKETLFGECVSCIQLLNFLLSLLDGLVMSTDALHIEHEGWKLQTSVAMAREWRSLMAMFSSKCQQTLLLEFRSLVSASAEVCKTATPAWMACFKDESYNQQLAMTMLKGKLKRIVDAHNLLHQVLVQLNSAAKSLAITPRLQDHELTAEPIAVALKMMQDANLASVVCMGVDVLASWEGR